MDSITLGAINHWYLDRFIYCRAAQHTVVLCQAVNQSSQTDWQASACLARGWETVRPTGKFDPRHPLPRSAPPSGGSHAETEVGEQEDPLPSHWDSCFGLIHTDASMHRSNQQNFKLNRACWVTSSIVTSPTHVLAPRGPSCPKTAHSKWTDLW